MEENKALKTLRKCCRLLCHQKPERCFTYKGYLFPLCARCTGILIAFITSLVLLACKIHIAPVPALIMLLIMCADWAIQALKIKESTNGRRFVTGLIGGFGMSYVFYYAVNFLMELL